MTAGSRARSRAAPEADDRRPCALCCPISFGPRRGPRGCGRRSECEGEDAWRHHPKPVGSFVIHIVQSLNELRKVGVVAPITRFVLAHKRLVALFWVVLT